MKRLLASILLGAMLIFAVMPLSAQADGLRNPNTGFFERPSDHNNGGATDPGNGGRPGNGNDNGNDNGIGNGNGNGIDNGIGNGNGTENVSDCKEITVPPEQNGAEDDSLEATAPPSAPPVPPVIEDIALGEPIIYEPVYTSELIVDDFVASEYDDAALPLPFIPPTVSIAPVVISPADVARDSDAYEDEIDRHDQAATPDSQITPDEAPPKPDAEEEDSQEEMLAAIADPGFPYAEVSLPAATRGIPLLYIVAGLLAVSGITVTVLYKKGIILKRLFLKD